jgi:RTX calcium-binding nonapeptide repeat (4 copies)
VQQTHRTNPARRWLGLALLAAAAVVIAVGGQVSIGGSSTGRVIKGTDGRDVLKGTSGADRIYAYAGDDRINGFAGNDTIVGGKGRDFVAASRGNDQILARDGASDRVDCGPGRDRVVADFSDRIWGGCEQVSRPGGQTKPPPAPPPTGNSVVLYDEPFLCEGPVDIGLVKVTMPSTVQDAMRLAENCSGRIGRIEIDTWTADGIKVQNHGTVAHDLVIESGYVKCHDVAGSYHQDGIQAMGGTRLTFRKLTVDCLGNANFFVNQGGLKVSMPTEVICDRCVLGPNSAQTLFVNTSIGSGTRGTTICEGRYRAVRIGPKAQALVNENNKVLPQGHTSCADVTGRGPSS